MPARAPGFVWCGRVTSQHRRHVAAVAVAVGVATAATVLAGAPSGWAASGSPRVLAAGTVLGAAGVDADTGITTWTQTGGVSTRGGLEAARASRSSREGNNISDAAEREWSPPVRRYQIGAVFGQGGEHWHYRHTGLDYAAPWGTPALAVTDAIVLRVGTSPAYGNVIILRTDPGVAVWYCHLQSIAVKAGQHVDAGQRIGRVGATGNAFGPHVHLEVRVNDRPTDPAIYLITGLTGPDPGWLPRDRTFMPFSAITPR